MRYADAVDDAGITERQGTHWRMAGFVHAIAYGSGGGPVECSEAEAAVLARMALLVRAGFTPAAAARVARAGGRVVDLDGVRVVFDVASREA